MHMQVTTVFKNGISTQAVRIPKEFRLPTKDVWIEKKGNSLVITPKPSSWDDFFDDATLLSKDFVMDHSKESATEREGFEE